MPSSKDIRPQNFHVMISSRLKPLSPSITLSDRSMRGLVAELYQRARLREEPKAPLIS